MIKIHIMNLLHDVPKGDFPPPQSEARIRCCSAKLDSIEFSIRTATTIGKDISRAHPSRASRSRTTLAVHSGMRSSDVLKPLQKRRQAPRFRLSNANREALSGCKKNYSATSRGDKRRHRR